MKLFNKVAIIGVGLIGGSVGIAIKKRRLANKVLGFGRNKKRLALARRIGAIDGGTLKLKDAVSDADLIVLATPPSLIGRFLKGSLHFSKPSAIFMDVASVKGCLTREVERIKRSNLRFVGAHPLAGSHQVGAAYSRANLFEGAVCILTRTKRTDKKAFSLAKKLWTAFGARVVLLSPALHDKIVAQVSHLPHLASSALTSTPNRRALGFAASGFKDTTRIASGDPLMWRDICLSNRAEIIRAMDKFTGEFNTLKGMVSRGDASGLLKKFQQVKKIRDNLT